MVLHKLRALIAQHGLGYYLVLTGDDHNSEYVSPSDKRRAFITEFTGSAGTAVIGADYAELATDGRYWLQADAQLPPGWALRKEGAPRVVPWLRAVAARARAEEAPIGVDPRLITYADAQSLKEAGADLRAVEPNLVDLVWTNRPVRAREPVYELETQYTGRKSQLKIADLRHDLRKQRADAIVLTALDDVAWLLNMRGSDIEYNPVFRAFLLVTHHDVKLYIDSDRDMPTEALVESGIAVRPHDEIYADVATLAREATVWVPQGSSWAMALAAGDSALLDRPSPVQLAKSIKNSVELEGARKAQVYCGVSLVEQLSWLQAEIRAGRSVSEYEAAEKLLEIRRKLPQFKYLSFETISSSGPSAAVIHYSPPKEGSRLLSKRDVYLLDSGSHFLFGTTDTTRTAWFDTEPPPGEISEAYTLVLKGHIALAVAIFPDGTPGSKLDMLARQFLWKYGLNYIHGTGHGVGSFLNVHEGPASISMHSHEPVHEGFLLSNEPGFYKDGHFGIRIESLLAATRSNPKYASAVSFLEFETITIVPFDRNLIDPSLLTPEELAWINAYHEMCREKLTPLVSDTGRAYLEYHTAPIMNND